MNPNSEASGSDSADGPSVRGGLDDEQPSLTELDAGDLRQSIDFGGVYPTVLENGLGLAA